MQNRFEYLLFITLAKFARTLPRGHVLFLGHRLGDLARYVLPRRAGIARSNLSRAFPERSREERECDLRKNFRILGAFVGANLFQSAFTDWCPMMTILRKLGVREG